MGVLLRVPSPLTDSALTPPPAASDKDAASLSQAAARLRQAQAELRDQQWEHCVATCRRVLENISRLVSIPSAKQVFAVPADSRTQDQRWAAVYRDVKGMTHAAHHDDSHGELLLEPGRRRGDLGDQAGLPGRYTQG
ncbi:hypothetical protein AB0B20_25270 [Micromonospora sp. NPDC049151]|uniref:hypothetical protein n=1 Tax=Micromonospora sp. NPDC049151 TaxID=3155648 RepID=UPI0033D986BA